MAISGAGNTPTFSWTAPTGSFDTQRILIRDITDLRGGGVSNVIYTKDIGSAATSFSLNPNDPALTQQLSFGRAYSLELDAVQLRNALGPNTFPNTLSQSRTFIDFVLLPTGSPNQVFLPFTNTSNPLAPAYQFNSIPVVSGQSIYIDPLIAIGYDYQISAGDPNFASVLLPTGIGDNLYQLFLWDGTNWVFRSSLTGGLQYFFEAGGVDRFRILGIEISALIDPLNTVAFITGLTFVGDGLFSGTMTAITEFVAEAPLPGALSLFVTGLALLGAAGRRRRRKASA